MYNKNSDWNTRKQRQIRFKSKCTIKIQTKIQENNDKSGSNQNLQWKLRMTRKQWQSGWNQNIQTHTEIQENNDKSGWNQNIQWKLTLKYKITMTNQAEIKIYKLRMKYKKTMTNQAEIKMYNEKQTNNDN